MEPSQLIPTPDTIPAPAWLFIVLENVLFLLHILVVNFIIGGSLFLSYRIFFSSGRKENDKSFQTDTSHRLPIAFAIGVNLGIAPLLFLQVVYGHLFYTSSILMAVYWILVIPLLIMGYYGAYVHDRNQITRPTLSRVAILVTTVVALYISFMLVNNVTLMMQPSRWPLYFSNRNGTLLNLGDSSLYPRHLHFLVASLAVFGLLRAFLAWRRERKDEEAISSSDYKAGLRLFAIATLVQIGIGFWYLLSLPGEIISKFMGQNLFATILLSFGILMALGALISAFFGKLIPTLAHFIFTMLAMIVLRAQLRSFYLKPYFDSGSLVQKPQYDVLLIFLVILIIGLAIVYWMLTRTKEAHS